MRVTGTRVSVSEDGGLRLAAYRDDPVIRFAAQDTLPGLGFFADAQTETQPFADVSVQLRGDELVMDWPEVSLSNDVAFYLRQGQPVLVPHAPTEGWVRIYQKREKFLGVGEVLDDGRIAPRRLLKESV